MTAAIRARLFEMQDEKYRAFHSKLMPTVDAERVIGVRTPQLRKYASELHKGGAAGAFLAELPHVYYEENNLHAFLIEKIRDYDACVAALDAFLPFVDNWASCDMMNPKVLGRHRDRLISDIRRWMASEHAYTVRYGIKKLMDFYLEGDFRPEYLEMAANVRSGEYYVRMMVAWFFATALAKQWEAALPYLQMGKLEEWTRCKAIQKGLESDRISAGQKDVLRCLRK